MVIYKTTNLINSMIYVGKDCANNKNYLGSGKLIKSAILKYGKNNFKKEILEICNSNEELCKREIYWIKKLNALDKSIGYNIAEGGDGGCTTKGRPKTEDEKRKTKEGNIKTWSDPTVLKKHSERMKEIFKDEKIKEHRINAWTKDKREIRSKLISETWKLQSPIKKAERCKRISNSHKKKIICDGVKYVSITDAQIGTSLSYHLLKKKINDENELNWYMIK